MRTLLSVTGALLGTLSLSLAHCAGRGADGLPPYGNAGSSGGSGGALGDSSSETAAAATLWAQKNGCQTTYQTMTETGSGGNNGQCYLYDGCPSDGQVEL